MSCFGEHSIRAKSPPSTEQETHTAEETFPEFNGHPIDAVAESMVMVEYKARQKFPFWNSETENYLSLIFTKIKRGNEKTKDDKFDLNDVVEKRIEELLTPENGNGSSDAVNSEEQQEWLMIRDSGVPFAVQFQWLADNRKDGEEVGDDKTALPSKNSR